MAPPDPLGRPTSGVGFGRGNSVVAGSRYYKDLDNALSLLASADAQRSSPNNTAGEAMRFFNMFRDSRLSERPDVVDTQRFIDQYNARPEVRQGPPLEFSDEYLGGSSRPYFPQDVVLNEAAKYDNGRNPQFSVEVTGPKFGTNVEVSPYQYSQAQLSSRAGLPVPLTLQLLLDRFASPNFRVGSTVQGVADVIPAGALRNLDTINFVDPEASSTFSGSRGDSIGGYQAGRDIYFPIDERLDEQSGNALARFLGLGGNPFSNTLRHELGHSLDYVGRPVASNPDDPSYLSVADPSYTQAILNDASLLGLQSSVDWDMASRRGLGGEYSPYVTAYGATSILEDFAERMAMYLTDREQGRIAGRDGMSYRFADLYPESARYFDEILSRG